MTTTRRSFLQAAVGSSAMLSFGGATPAWLLRATRSLSPATDGDRVLVVLQLTGGNDGLNTLVPFEDDAYARSRPTLRFSRKQVHQLGSELGLHPRMEACARLAKDGKLAVVQGVGHPGGSRSHAPAMRVWQTAQPGDRRQTGWIGEAADEMFRRSAAPLPAAFVGSIRSPLALNAAEGFVPALRSERDLILRRFAGPMPESPARGDDPLLDHVRRAAAGAREASRRIEATLGDDAPAGAYPDVGLARRLATIARLIRADVGTRIYFTELGGGGFGGFDNHANQLGNHCALLHQLSTSLAGFVDDLERDRLLDRVLLMTFSEFGRTLAENGRRGTGHGAAAPVLLAGGCLKNGPVIGDRPSLARLTGGAPRVLIDFRRVYATVLDWLGLDRHRILGAPFQPLDILKS